MKLRDSDFNLKTNERNIILRCLEFYSGNIHKAAYDLGITRATLYRKLKEYDINPCIYREMAE